MIRLGDKGIFTFFVWLTEPVFWTDSEMSVLFGFKFFANDSQTYLKSLTQKK